MTFHHRLPSPISRRGSMPVGRNSRVGWRAGWRDRPAAADEGSSGRLQPVVWPQRDPQLLKFVVRAKPQCVDTSKCGGLALPLRADGVAKVPLK